MRREVGRRRERREASDPQPREKIDLFAWERGRGRSRRGRKKNAGREKRVGKSGEKEKE